MTLLSFAVGLALGAGHFALFRWSFAWLMAAGPARHLAIAVLLTMRHMLLAAFFFALWKLAGLEPLAMGIGICVAYAVLRIALVRRLRE